MTIGAGYIADAECAECRAEGAFVIEAGVEERWRYIYLCRDHLGQLMTAIRRELQKAPDHTEDSS